MADMTKPIDAFRSFANASKNDPNTPTEKFIDSLGGNRKPGLPLLHQSLEYICLCLNVHHKLCIFSQLSHSYLSQRITKPYISNSNAFM
jgi:hypothetical protein